MKKAYFNKNLNINLTAHEVDQIEIALDLYYQTLLKNAGACHDSDTAIVLINQAMEIKEIILKAGKQKEEAQ